MKNKFKLFILSALMLGMACFAMGGCGSLFGSSESSEASSESVETSSSQAPTWEDEDVEDQEHDEIELPEVLRP